MIENNIKFSVRYSFKNSLIVEMAYPFLSKRFAYKIFKYTTINAWITFMFKFIF